VHYDLNVVEGDLYRMGELEITGLDTKATAVWWKRGPARRPTLQCRLPQEVSGRYPQLLPRGVSWGTTIHETPDAKDKTVDVEIRFKQQ